MNECQFLAFDAYNAIHGMISKATTGGIVNYLGTHAMRDIKCLLQLHAVAAHGLVSSR